MILRQKIQEPWGKAIYDWSIHGVPQQDNKGWYIRIGSWVANHWFHVAVGKTVKQTLFYAKQHLRAITQKPCTFEYID